MRRLAAPARARFRRRRRRPSRSASATASGSARAAAVLCTAQSLTADPALSDMFDRGYSITCRDAAVPVGRLYVLRERGDDPAARLRGAARRRASCAQRASGRDRGSRPGRDRHCLRLCRRRRRPLSRLSSTGAGQAVRRRGAGAAMTARCGSACAASSPTGSSRARSRSRPPAPAIPPPSPASRPARSIRSGRSPRPIAATMPAAMPSASEFFGALTQRDGAAVNRAEAVAQRGAAEIQSRPLRRSRRAVRRRRGDGRGRSGDRAPAAQLSRDAPAQPGPRRRGDGRARPADAADRLERGGARPRHRPADRRPAQRRIAGREPAARPGGADAGGQGPDPRRPGAAAARHDPAPAGSATPRRWRRSTRRSTSWSRSAAGGSPRPSGCARRSWASSPTSPRGAATGPRPSGCIWRRSPCSRPIIPARPPCSAPRAGSPAIMPAPGAPSRRWPCSARSSPPMPTAATARPACGARSSPISSLLAARGDGSGGGRRSVRGEPDPGPARRRPDPGGAGARAFRRQRRGGAPVPPVGQPDARHRARPGRARAAPGAPSSRPRRAAPGSPSSRASLGRLAAGPGRDPGAARRIPALPGGVERHDRARRPAAPAPPGRGLLQDDRSSATAPMRSSPRARGARAFRIGASPAALDAPGRCAARDHLGRRAQPAAHLSVRRRARLRALPEPVRAGRRRDRRGRPT